MCWEVGLLGGRVSAKGFHLEGWDQVCAGLENGDGALQSLADIQLRLHGGRSRAVLGRV